MPNRELLFDKGKLKIPEKKSKSLQRLKHPGYNHPSTLPQFTHRNLLMDPQGLGNLWHYQTDTAVLGKRLVISFILT